ncbi:MAG: glycine--tRNA ligase subunit beta, partial [Candidatus Cloacimonetes bacterium]|nr:glycine--tRNA ligase subunit beta [Candidatus Cloacimonadota bacterium]
NKGEETFNILQKRIPELFKKFNFPKTMRWGSSALAFARPIRWIVAIFAEQLIPIKINGISAGKISYGNRYQKLSNVVEINSPQDYETSLLSVKVIANRETRKDLIIQQMGKLFADKTDEVIEDKKLLEVVTDLVEFPTAVIGFFDKKYLELPQKIITSTLSQHQKYFAVRSANGELTNKFVFISNGNPEYSDLIRSGNEKVIIARLDDASFFYKEDTSIPLEKYIPKLNEVLFQSKLGSLLNKTERITNICNFLSKKLNLSSGDTIKAMRAASLCKADLVTLMLGEKEFTKLQGYIGMKYALVAGEEHDIATAIYEHYQPRGQNDDLPASLIGSLVAIADKLDTVCGIIGVDMVPSGSNDPFALRRAANGIVQIIAAKELGINLIELIDFAFTELADKLERKNHNRELVYDFFKQRVGWLLKENNIDHDVMESVMHVDFSDIADIKQRAGDLQKFKQKEDFTKLVIGFKRVSNIIAKADNIIEIKPELLEAEAEKDLYESYQVLQPEIDKYLVSKDYVKVMERLVNFGEKIDQFFDNVMVNAEDETLKQNRYALLALIQTLFYKVADIAKIVVK